MAVRRWTTALGLEQQLRDDMAALEVKAGQKIKASQYNELA